MEQIEHKMTLNAGTKTYRWYFYIASVQFLMYFIVPLTIFPGEVIKDIEIISALTLGTIVGVFFGLVNIVGFILDKPRRVMHTILLFVIAAYLAWVVVSWAFIERMDFLLR
jgi:hypothetical protein